MQPTLCTLKKERFQELCLFQRFDNEGTFRSKRRLRDCYKKLSDRLHRPLGGSTNGIYCFKIDCTAKQNDGGANRSITNLKHLLTDFITIPLYRISGVKDKEIAVQCTGFGYIPLSSDNGERILVPCYYLSKY